MPNQKFPSHHDSLHLIRSLVYLRDLCISHHPLDGEVFGVTVATKELYGIGGDLHCYVGGKALSRCPEIGQVGVPTLRSSGRGVCELARSLQLHAHVGEHELQALELSKGFAELFALLYIT